MKKALSLVLALMMLMSLCITPVMAAEPDGSESNPYYVANPMVAPSYITIPANSTVYYQYNAAVFGGWEVGGYGLSAIIVDGVVFDEPDMWGEIYAFLNFTFVSPGIVGYVNDSAEDVEVYLAHNEPIGSASNPDVMLDGENTFTIPAYVFPYVAIYMPMANGEHTFSCDQGEDFVITIDADGDFEDGVYETLDGSLTLNLESYIPVQVMISPLGMTPDVTINVTAPVSGTKENPIWLDNFNLEDSYVMGNAIYFQVDGSLSGNTLNIASEWDHSLTVVMDGVEYVAEGGQLSLVLEASDWYIDLAIFQDQDVENTLTFSIDYAEGTMGNPIEIVYGDNAISIPEGADGYYYVYDVESDGLLIVTPSAVDGIGYLCMANADYSTYAYLQEGASSMMMPVTAGELILLECYPIVDEESWVSLPLDVTLNLAQKDLALFTTFESGETEGWSSSSNLSVDDVDYASGWYSAKFEVTADWGNIYNYVKLEPNTDYVVSFKAKAALEKGAWIKFNDNWGPDIAQGDVSLTTEWADYEVVLNSGDHTEAVLLVQYAGYAADGQTIWLDDFIITKAEAGDIPEPPVTPDTGIVNGGFETGDAEGWETWQDTSISADAAHSGSYGAHLVGNGGWGGMLNQTVTVEAGKTYKLSFWLNVNATGINVQVKDGSGTAIEGAGGWFDAKNVDKVVEWVFTAPDDTVLINFCGSGTQKAEDVYVDDFALTEMVVKEPSFDGYIYNGDFETGDLSHWENLWGSCDVSFVEGYESDTAVSITAGGWSQVRQNGIVVEPNTDYVLTAWVKANTNFGIIVKTGDDSGDIANVIPEAGEDWQLATLKFNSGDQSEICVLLIGWDGGGSAVIDNVSLAKDEGGDIPEPPVTPDTGIVNSGFETGDASGWEIWQDTTISADAAHSGSYGAHLIGDGGWGGMLNQTVTVEAGKTYKLSFWLNVNATGVNVQVKDGSGTAIEGAGGWFDAKNVDKVVEWVFTAPDDTVLINFCGSGVSPEDVYVDDFALTEMVVKEPSFDGYIYNGDFETGDLSHWENLWGSCDVSFVEGYESDTAVSITAGGWSQVRQNEIAVQKNTNYVLTAWVKANTNFGIIVKTGDDSADISSILIEDGADWQLVTLEFNSGDQSEVCVLLIGWEGGGSAIIDNVSLVEGEAPVVPDYTPGDINGDGKINNKDLGVLKQYLADWVVELNRNACDVNGDGKLNNKDMGLLQQYLNDWDVELQYGALAE